MTRSPAHPARRASLIAGAAAVLVLTAACSGGSDEPAPGDTPSAGGGSQSDAPTEVEADGLPVGFPRDEVPVVGGEIVSVQEPTADSGAFNLLIYVGDTPRRTIVEQAVGQLQDAGWSLKTSIEAEPPAAQVLTKQGGTAQQVILTNSFQRNESAISYTVQVQS